ncbi:hypothetical protein GGH99_002471 [Coemansia sp. RSA 1285]|nr:hypothetical protein GGH99_002471 [Coemansia sp. RSA 1285]
MNSEKDSLSALLSHDSLGRRMWLQFQAAADLADIRDMVADSATGILILPQTAYRHNTAEEPDISDMLNDNVLFTESPLLTGDINSVQNGETADALSPPAVHKFTTLSGICGTIDCGSVSALGTLPPMEDIMQAISEDDTPHTTIFDVLDTGVMTKSLPLLRFRIVAVCKDCKLPDGRGVQVVITSGLLERNLVVDSAVTTLSARIYDAIDATYGAMLPNAPESITACDKIKVDIEAVMQYARSVELRRPVSSGTGSTVSGKPRKFSWISGQGSKPHRSRSNTFSPSASSMSPSPAHASLALSGADAELPTPTSDSENWQALVLQLQNDISDYLLQLEKETSICGDPESRKDICVALTECVEKLVMEAIYLQIFSPPSSLCDDRAQDEQLASKVAALNMADISLEHLGLPVLPETKGELLRICVETGKLLDRMNAVKSPAEKLKFVVDAHKGVVDRMQRLNERLHALEMRRQQQAALENRANAEDEEAGEDVAGAKSNKPATKDDGTSKPPVLSADSILPLLIYSVVKANPSKFVSNLRYVQRYRTRALLASQFEYCLTNAQAAASFVDSVDAKQLGLSAELSSSALERAMPPALAALHNLLVNNVVSNVGMEVVQGVADGSRKVAVGVFDATLGRLIDTSSQLIFKGGWRSPSEREMQQASELRDNAATEDAAVDEKTVDQDNVFLGVSSVLGNASAQLSHGIKGHLPRKRSPPVRGTGASPKVNERFLRMQAEDLTIKEVTQLLESYKELAIYLNK